MKQLNLKKLVLLNLPYFLLGLFATNLGEAWRLATGADASAKMLSFFSTLPVALGSWWPSLHPLDLAVGICCGAGLRLAVYLKGKNAKKYRHNVEYGSARWGTHEDIAPYIDPVFQNNVILTQTERLTMSSRPKNPKYARNKNVLVILTDMTSYCEALREFSSSKGEIPGRKGFPGYLYSDLASLYERAGIIKGSKGSVTQIPILTMPGDDITHPIPDLTGYITEGQIVLDRGMDATGLYPPVSVLPSLSRLMKDGIGAGYTREDHVTLSNQLFACYAKVQDAKALASVIGEEELSQSDKQLMAFGRAFEQEFIGQGNTDRTMEQTLDLGWELLATLPRNALDRCDAATLDKYYEPAKARISKK